MRAGRDLVPFLVTATLASGFFVAVARWSRPAHLRGAPPAPASAAPQRAIAPERPRASVPRARNAPTPPPTSPPTSPQETAPRRDATPAVGRVGPGDVARARAQLDALRARLEAIEEDAGAAPVRAAQGVLASAAAPAIHEALGDGPEGFDDRYDAYRAIVLDGGSAEAASARVLLPEDRPRAAVLDELNTLLRQAR